LNVGVSPDTGLLNASANVIEMVEAVVPSAGVGPVPEMFELIATAGPALKITVPSDLLIGAVMERVFVSAFVDFKVHVETPVEFVTLQEL
jgi:hypothetical protein